MGSQPHFRWLAVVAAAVASVLVLLAQIIHAGGWLARDSG